MTSYQQRELKIRWEHWYQSERQLYQRPQMLQPVSSLTQHLPSSSHVLPTDSHHSDIIYHESPVIFIYKGPVSKNLSKWANFTYVSKQTERENASLKSTGMCSCPKGLRVTITTAIQTYGIWPLLQNFHIYAEFREIQRKHGNSAATAKFRGSARNSAAHGKLWALVISSCYITYTITR